MSKQAKQICTAEFKAECLSLIDEIYEGKRDYVIITKHGKPYAKLVPIDSEDRSFYGCMKGLATIHGDLTKPVDVEWKP